MNERIKELATQAGITTNLKTDFYEKDMNSWVGYYTGVLSQLIINECCEQVGYEDAIADIKKHFGVTE
jgi:hypothetical protein